MRGHAKLGTLVVCASFLLPYGHDIRLVATPQSRAVNVLVSVTDKQGGAVQDLKEADFIIREDGKPQTITSVMRADQSPLSIVLLIDKSGSTHDSAREMTKAIDASIEFFRSVLQPARDKVALVTFDSFVAREQDFTDDLQRLSQIMTATLARPSGGGTALHDAIFGASTLLQARAGRRIILIVGDGVDTASRFSLPEAMKIVQMSDIEIVAIWTPSPNPSGAIFASKMASSGRESLKKISDETGGRYLAHTELKGFDKIRQEVNAQYLIGYQSTNSKLDDKLRSIRVEHVNKSYKLRHRTGYRVQ